MADHLDEIHCKLLLPVQAVHVLQLTCFQCRGDQPECEALWEGTWPVVSVFLSEQI